MGCSWLLAIAVFIVTGRFYLAVIAFFIGWAFDSKAKREKTENPDMKTDFINNLLVLFAYVVKADGRVTKLEVYYIRHWLEENFGTDTANQSMLVLRDLIKQDTINLQQTCVNINRRFEYSQKLELIHLLFGISSSDNEISRQELNVIHTIASYLRISAWDFGTIQAIYFNSQSYTQDYNQYGGNSFEQGSETQLNNAYQILQVEKTATEDEIKKSYRSLVKKYHPDKVATLGKEIQKQAEEKLQQINNAYEMIKKERNFH